MTTLLLSARHTADNQALWRAAIQRDWPVVRVQGIRLPELNDPEIVIYVEALFAPTIAGMLGRSLLDAPVDWLVTLPHHLTKRRIELTTLGQARNRARPAFVKPPHDKSFAAKVYNSGDLWPVDLDDDTPVLVAEPVEWGAEFRCFCLDGRVRACSPYLRSGVLARHTNHESASEELAAATEFAEAALATPGVGAPNAIVLDVGQMVGKGWAVVESNGAWGSGIYGCDPDGALEVIRRATSTK